MQLSRLLLDNFWLGLAHAGRLHPRARPERHGVEVLRDLRYAPGGREHLLDVYRPKSLRGSEARPALLYLHGGGFRILSKDTHWVMGLAFARMGHVVFNASYRLAPAHPYPAALDDAAAALAWIVAHGAEHGADPRRLVLAGESAGANLALALTVAACYPREEPAARAVRALDVVPRAVLPICGVLQVSDLDRLARRRLAPRRALPPWVRGHLATTESAYLGRVSAPDEAHGLADPLLVLEGGAPERPLPPCFAAVGTCDPLLDDTRRLKAALDRLGVLCEVRYYPGELHAFHAFVWREAARRCWGEMRTFLETHVAHHSIT